MTCELRGDTRSDDAHASSIEPSEFHPLDRTKSVPSIQLPDEIWLTVLESQCTFSPKIFLGVMLNLIKNPNISSSLLFRADIYYDSGENGNDAHGLGQADGLLAHLKAEYRPLHAQFLDYDLKRTIVRQLIPRNPQLDKALIQTSHLFQRLDEDGEENAVLYIPHVEQADEMPFYHPTVARLAFRHTWRRSRNSAGQSSGSVSICYSLFAGTTLDSKLERTALKILQIIHKHGQGQLAGYEKRVHHDQIIPQKRYQDTYTWLKAKYGKQLAQQWVEVTDPGKHVFEDIGIAAFLIELWRDMYAPLDAERSVNETSGANGRPSFPGFVDLGCGNGHLVYILLSEGYAGWGFDARQRKTWSIFPEDVQAQLKQRLLMPKVFLTEDEIEANAQSWHTGIFMPGTFIISNHADEITAWTPLLAYLNSSAFIAIPCCSHDLAGSRFRAPPFTKWAKGAPAPLPQQATSSVNSTSDKQAAEAGSLKRTETQKKMPSAYSTLCSYVSSLAEEVGFESEKEVLRIPSTRNQCIIGRTWKQREVVLDVRERWQKVTEVVEAELNRHVAAVGRDWVERAEKLVKKPGSGH